MGVIKQEGSQKLNRCEKDSGEMVTRISGQEFRSTGMLWFINSILHLFGFAIVWDEETDEIYPAICKFRGFSEEKNDEGYLKVTHYLADNILDILKDFGK